MGLVVSINRSPGVLSEVYMRAKKKKRKKKVKERKRVRRALKRESQ